MVATTAAAMPPEAAVLFDLANHIETNTPLGKSQGIQSVLEAVANSIDAIADAKTKGKITIRVLRAMDEPVQMDIVGGKGNHPITGFEIEDDGVGFTDDNFASFSRGSTDYKKKRGGKGLGRLIYLKVFKHADVVSTFRSNGKAQTRSFTFTAKAENGIKDPVLEEAMPSQKTGTTIKLFDKYVSYQFPKKPITIARHILEYNIAELIANKSLAITLVDPDSEEGDIKLRDILADEYFSDDNIATFIDHGHRFQLQHVLAKETHDNQKHKVVFCARKLVAETHNLAKHVKQLSRPLTIDGKSRLYLGILSGAYFDKHVNATRRGIGIDDDNEGTIAPDSCRNGLLMTVGGLVLERFKEPLGEIRRATDAKVSTLINSSAPELRQVYADNPDVLDRLTVTSDDSEVYAELAGLRFKERKQYLEEVKAALDKAGSGKHLERLTKENKERFYRGAHKEATSCLIQFVFHRRCVLDLLNIYLGDMNRGKKEKEEAIHNLVFPMRNTSDKIPVEATNLWVLDERLAFHRYLASDMSFCSHEVLESESERRADIAVYHLPDPKFWHASFALSEQENNASSVTLIEFKQPGRDNYTRIENPHEQIMKYVLDIREGKLKDRQGRPFANPERIRFFCLVALDLTSNLANMLHMNYGYKQTADGDGWYFAHPTMPVYIEVMSYQKMIDDATKRNRSYFEALKLPTNG